MAAPGAGGRTDRCLDQRCFDLLHVGHLRILRADQLAALDGRFAVTDLAGQIASDFRDTAAAIECLDLVITVDTSVAHLAGALGRPVWVLMPYYPDWRWRRNGDQSVWYPTARLFRQRRRGDWSEVFERVAAELGKLRPQTRKVTVDLEPAEWAVLAALRDPAALWPGDEADHLRAAIAAHERVETEMETLVQADMLDGRASELVLALVQARHDRDCALAAVRKATGI
jgi:hypothetical protein